MQEGHNWILHRLGKVMHDHDDNVTREPLPLAEAEQAQSRFMKTRIRV
jgi:hypothetical protein